VFEMFHELQAAPGLGVVVPALDDGPARALVPDLTEWPGRPRAVEPTG
jgi:hypothetical protein